MAIQRATEATPHESEATPSEPRLRPFTVDEYYKMAEVGILRPDERVQLIEGKIIELPRKSPPHAYHVTRLTELFFHRFRKLAHVRCQGPVRLSLISEPEPDLALFQRYPDKSRVYSTRHPGPDDTFLVLEVADDTVELDLGEKAKMYARYGIEDYWVVDLIRRVLVVHREPTADGYASVLYTMRSEHVSPLAFPDVRFTADEIVDGSEA
jgi:Uma2 family endonuclease